MVPRLWTLVSLLGATARSAGTDAFDYIIVGGGTSGLVLATRLSLGLPESKILVLEAGPAALDELRINVPGMRGSALFSEYDWNFTSVPQESLNGRSIDVNRGRVLGGSSALNYLCYDRAAAAEYEAWGGLGNEGWGWDVMLDAMLKSENFTGRDEDTHGHAGPIRSTYSRVVPEYLHTWKPTMNKLGIPTNEKSMSGNPIGVMFQVTNVDPTRWTRSYSANSYLPLARRNLEVRTNSRVVKVEFAKKTPGKPLTATGVVLEDGKKVRAAREVILSAGVIGSPGLLELSGIGQTKVIRAAGIEPVLELAGVGENYQDHIRSSNSYRLKKNFTSFDPLIYENTGTFAQQQLQLWLDGKYSWLDYTSSAYSFLNWDQIAGNSSSDLVALAKRVSSSDNSVAKRRTLEMLRDRSIPQAEIVMESNYVGVKGYPGGNFITIIYTVMHPLSRGYVHIDAANPLGKPIIDPRYMSNEYDIRAMVEIAKFSRKIAETEPMASVWEEEYEPGPGVRTDAQWRDFARNSTQSFFHPMGTCAMLPRKDGGVVDSSLVVHETSNLRVVDCSIIPVLLSAHPQTAAHGIAEIAAAMIIRKDRDHGHGGNSSDE